jgi:hypothetical protein
MPNAIAAASIISKLLMFVFTAVVIGNLWFIIQGCRHLSSF